MTLNRIDVTRYHVGDTIWGWLIPYGYVVTYDYYRNRVYLERSVDAGQEKS